MKVLTKRSARSCRTIFLQMLLYDHNVPPFLHSSPYLQALLNEGHIPESGIEIPDGCLKADLTVTTQNDLQELLQTFRFWLLPELAENCMELLRYAFEPVNKSDFLMCAAEFKDEIPFLNEIMQILGAETSNKVAVAAQFARRNVIKYLVEDYHCPITEQAGVVAAREGKSECLEYLHSRGLELSRTVCRAACCGGHLECVKFMIDNKAKTYRYCAQHSAVCGHFECAKYAVQNTNLSPEKRSTTIFESFQFAAQNDHVDCLLAMMREWGDAENTSSMVLEATTYGHLPVLMLAQQRGAQLEDFAEAMDAAAQNGHFDCLRYLHEIGCVPTVETLEYAAENGDRSMFMYLVDHNCPMDGSICETLAGDGQLELLQYAHEHGCPWDEGTCEAAAEDGHLECLRYAHENGCPWMIEDLADIGSVSGDGSEDESSDDDSDEEEEGEEGEETESDTSSGENSDRTEGGSGESGQGDEKSEVESGEESDASEASSWETVDDDSAAGEEGEGEGKGDEGSGEDEEQEGSGVGESDEESGEESVEGENSEASSWETVDDSATEDEEQEGSGDSVAESDSDEEGSGEEGSDEEGSEDEEEVEDITLSATCAPTIDCLLYIVDQGVPLHPHCGKRAAEVGNVEMLQYLHSRGFTWSAKDCAVVVEGGSLESLRFLHEIGTPWDARTCTSAASYGYLESLKYAHENGCPWDKNTCKKSETAECYEYAVAHGCPGAELNSLYRL